ncbi:MAG: hypothetical protein J7K29_03010 [Candidatus Cloacimonetes bacterium]|nr:hypothetical protein [Candidatus Cloacimonadota bacterium]
MDNKDKLEKIKKEIKELDTDTILVKPTTFDEVKIGDKVFGTYDAYFGETVFIGFVLNKRRQLITRRQLFILSPIDNIDTGMTYFVAYKDNIIKLYKLCK